MFEFLVPGLFRGPLRLEVSHDKGPHSLGDEMPVAVEVQAKRDVVVEEGRIELVCHERWAETWIKPEPMGRSAGMLKRGAELAGPTAPKREAKEFKNTFVHSTVAFAEGLRVRPGSPERLNVRLPISKDWPPHAKGGTLTWELVVVLKRSSGRETSEVSEIEVVVP